MEIVTDILHYLVYVLFAGTALYMIVCLWRAASGWCRGQPEEEPALSSEPVQYHQQVHIHVHMPPHSPAHALLVTPVAVPSAPPMSPTALTAPRTEEDERTARDLALALELQQKEHERLRQAPNY